jgi:hypothetical protein
LVRRTTALFHARSRGVAVLAGAVLGALLLSGCTGGGATPADDSNAGAGTSATPLPTVQNSPLMAERPEDFTAETAATETVRVADEIQTLVDPSTILNVDDHPEMLDSADGATQYYGVLRLISLTEGTDPTLLARVLVAQLVAAGWTEVNTEDTAGSYFVALASSDSESDSWFLLLGGDTSEEGFPAVTLQLASPTLPAS